MTRQKVIQRQVEEIMDEFNFHEIRDVFEQNKWAYYGNDDTPSVADLRKVARRLLYDVSEKPQDGCVYLHSARFLVMSVEDTKEKWIRISLFFAPESWYVDEGEEYSDLTTYEGTF